MSDAEIRERVREQISMRHPNDTPEFWRGLGPSAPRVIREMLAESSGVYERIRLTEGLGWFDSEEAREAIRSAAEREGNRSLLRTQLRSVLRTPGDSPADEVAFVEKFLDRDDPALRAQVAGILAESGSPEALQAIERQLKREKTPWVSERMRRSRDESVRLAERERKAGTQLVIAGRGSRVKVGSDAEGGLDAAFDGRWEGRWIGPSEHPDRDGVLTRLVSLTVRLEKDPSAKSAGAPRNVLRLEAQPAVPPQNAPSAAAVPFVLKGEKREARATLKAAEWKSLTSGLNQVPVGDGSLTIVARLIDSSTLVLESEDGRQHWVFARAKELRVRQ